ncbi:MAG: hypothetical protein RLY97_1146 [Pseudomonadota bacterium]|jgi:hypothetical protein
MRLFFFPLCWINRHRPNRHRAKWDGTHYVGNCKNCGKRIRKRDGGLWQKDWMDKD